MTSAGFNPFISRQARDMRNSLSRSFFLALTERDVTKLQNCGDEYLQQKLAPDYEIYLRNRLKRYAEALDIIQQKKLRDVLPQAAVLWDLGLYFEMHELLEPEWKNAEGDKRKALQGLIRAAGMKIHEESNNIKAAVSIGLKARTALVKYGDRLAAFAKLDVILAAIHQTLANAQNPRQGDRV